MNTTKLVMAYAIVILSLSINLVYTQQQCESAICTQLSQLCSANVDNRYSPITPGVPGKKGPKGEKGDSSTYEENEEKDRRFAGQFASLHEQLTSVQDENQRLQAALEETKETCNNKITGVEDHILRILKRDDSRLKLCGLLHLPSKIEDSRFSANSIYHSHAKAAAYQGRLFSTSGYGGWLPHTNKANQWIQVDLEQNERIYGVATQGRTEADQWVTSYSVSYKTDIGGSFRVIDDESGDAVVFQGNTDRSTPVIHDLPQPIIARYFRINPLLYQEFTVIRFDLLIC